MFACACGIDGIVKKKEVKIVVNIYPEYNCMLDVYLRIMSLIIMLVLTVLKTGFNYRFV